MARAWLRLFQQWRRKVHKIVHRAQCLGRFLGIICQDYSLSNSHWSHVVIFRLFFKFLIWNTLQRFHLKRSVIFLTSWAWTGYFSISTGPSVTSVRFSRFDDDAEVEHQAKSRLTVKLLGNLSIKTAVVPTLRESLNLLEVHVVHYKSRTFNNLNAYL